ncbi:hypothetical protein CJ255_13000 [Candidatus Viridilinea mediisalina]|uniref:Uncharacterized protein n=1 Tax=Candidatus Viridilinea mediisalina TaxID=2024553 RepID=A0A2A6RIC2_9CHLR|nr:hypothetical protein CJ255_13000 [Candidatus Viridilinea mediisalina]
MARGTLGTIMNSFVSIVETARAGFAGELEDGLPPGAGAGQGNNDNNSGGNNDNNSGGNNNNNSGGGNNNSGGGSNTPPQRPNLPPPPPTMTPLPDSQEPSAWLCYVPDLRGIKFTDARDIVWAREGFDTSKLNRSGGNNNMIIGQQSIEAGSMVDCDSSMTVQSGSCTIPNMVNMTWSDALSAWTGAGFADDQLQRPADADSDFVVGSQSVAAGSVVNGCRQSVTLTPGTCTVPNLVGRNFNTSGTSVAHTVWGNAGFGASQLTTDPANPTNFEISSQSLVVGTTVDCQTASMTVTPAQTTCTVPQMVNQTVSGARASWAAAGFTTTPSFSKHNPKDDHIIASQSLAAASEVACDSNISLVEEDRMVVIALSPVSAQPGSTFTRAQSSNIVVRADAFAVASNNFNPDNLTGTNGSGVSHLMFYIIRSDGTTMNSQREGLRPYCFNGDANNGDGTPCDPLGFQWPADTYTIRIVAHSSSNNTSDTTLEYTITITD